MARRKTETNKEQVSKFEISGRRRLTRKMVLFFEQVDSFLDNMRLTEKGGSWKICSFFLMVGLKRCTFFVHMSSNF